MSVGTMAMEFYEDKIERFLAGLSDDEKRKTIWEIIDFSSGYDDFDEDEARYIIDCGNSHELSNGIYSFVYWCVAERMNFIHDVLDMYPGFKSSGLYDQLIHDGIVPDEN